MTTRHEHRRMREAATRVAKALRAIAADLPNLSAQCSDPLYALLVEDANVVGLIEATAEEIEDRRY